MPSDPSREGYSDDWEEDRGEVQPRGREYGLPTAANLNTRQIPPVVEKYQTPGPGSSAGIPRRDLELSKIEKQVEEIRAILRTAGVASTYTASEIKTALFKIELSTSYLKEHSHG